MSESKIFEELFCSVHVWTFFQKGGEGVALFQTFGGTSLLEFGLFQEGGGVT